jgi:H+/gluconate symporter-like permease
VVDLVNSFFRFHFFIILYSGGCTVTLVKKSSVEKCIETIKKGYKGTASFYEFEPSDGARSVELKQISNS